MPSERSSGEQHSYPLKNVLSLYLYDASNARFPPAAQTWGAGGIKQVWA